MSALATRVSQSVRRLAAPCALLAAACTASRETIEGEDASTFFPAAHVSWELTKRAEGEPPPSTRTALELEVAQASSESTQDLGPGEIIDLDDVLFLGPASVDVSYELWRVLLDFRASWQNPGGFGIDGIFGLAFDQLELELEDDANGRSDSESFETLGPLLGASLFYEPLGWLRFYAEGSYTPAFGGEVESATIQSLELGAHVRLFEHAALRAGWRQLSYEAERNSLDSDLDLVSKGPALTLWLSW
jgi:hypothetical protein